VLGLWIGNRYLQQCPQPKGRVEEYLKRLSNTQLKLMLEEYSNAYLNSKDNNSLAYKNFKAILGVLKERDLIKAPKLPELCDNLSSLKVYKLKSHLKQIYMFQLYNNFDYSDNRVRLAYTQWQKVRDEIRCRERLLELLQFPWRQNDYKYGLSMFVLVDMKWRAKRYKRRQRKLYSGLMYSRFITTRLYMELVCGYT
jgi:hypothetical protein